LERGPSPPLAAHPLETRANLPLHSCPTPFPFLSATPLQKPELPFSSHSPKTILSLSQPPKPFCPSHSRPQQPHRRPSPTIPYRPEPEPPHPPTVPPLGSLFALTNQPPFSLSIAFHFHFLFSADPSVFPNQRAFTLPFHISAVHKPATSNSPSPAACPQVPSLPHLPELPAFFNQQRQPAAIADRSRSPPAAAQVPEAEEKTAKPQEHTWERRKWSRQGWKAEENRFKK